MSLVSTALWLHVGIAAATNSDTWGAVGFAAFVVWLAWTAIASVGVARRVGPATSRRLGDGGRRPRAFGTEHTA